MAPLGQFLLKKSFVASVHEMAQHRMLRAIGLHQHLSRPLPPSGPARQLQQELQALLAGAQIGSVQQTIGRQHGGQGHPRQIHPLGEHLRAHEHIGLPRGEALE